MIEIKFRAWSTDSEAMYELDPAKKTGISLYELHEAESGTWKVMQFTGLHDKNGKEVYAGDIVGSPDKKIIAEVFQVQDGFNHGSWACLHKDGDLQTLWDAINGDGFEVVGNIYENKELLATNF